MLQYSKDIGDIHLFLRQARGLATRELHNIYSVFTIETQLICLGLKNLANNIDILGG